MAAPPGFAVLTRLPAHGEAVWVDDGGFTSGIVVHAPHEGKVSVSSVPGLPQSSHVVHDIAGGAVFYTPSR